MRQNLAYLRRRAAGFTLTELLVVMAVIGLLAATAIPSIFGMLSGAADARAYNLMAAVIATGRAEAVQRGTFAAVHVQMGATQVQSGSSWTWKTGSQWNRPIDGFTWVGVFTFNSATGAFVLADGYVPTPMPNPIVFGEVSGKFVGGDQFNSDAVTYLESDFTSFNLIFAPNGTLVRSVNGRSANLGTATNSVFLTSDASTPSRNTAAIWWAGDAQAEPGATALTMFDYMRYSRAPNKLDYLNESGQLISVNPYTGQLASRK